MSKHGSHLTVETLRRCDWWGWLRSPHSFWMVFSCEVATNTEGTKNTGNAILYECVLTIMSIEALWQYVGVLYLVVVAEGSCEFASTTLAMPT